MTDAKIIPERIREAREAAGFTDEQFAELVGVSRQSIGLYETGQVSPSGEVFSRIISVTEQPPAFFTTRRKRNAERFRTPNWRSLKRMNRPDRLRISRRLEWAYDVLELVEQHVNLPPIRIPPVEFDFDAGNEIEIEAIADATRLFWGIGNGPITDIVSLLEYNGIVLIRENVNCEDMDAVSRWQGGRPFILYSGDVQSNARTVFNLAHELAHIVLHAGVEVTSKNIDKLERQANRFAGAFLMPRATFVREVASTSLDYLLSLKQRWRVSVAAMVYRCRDLEILNSYQVQYIWKQMNARKIRKSEPLDNSFPLGEPTVLKSAVEMIMQAGRAAYRDVVSELALNPRTIEQLCGLPNGTMHNNITPLRLHR